MRAYPALLLTSGFGSFAGATAFTLNLVYQVEVVGLDPLRPIFVGMVMDALAGSARV